MLDLIIPKTELWNERENEFIQIERKEISLEHSLVSISKWESKWKIPYLDSSIPRTLEQSKDYVRCMTITQNVNSNIYEALTQQNWEEINKYIENDHSASKFIDFHSNGSANVDREMLTSELIYYWMTVYNIPFECQKWNFGRLMSLLKICNIKNSDNKMSSSETISLYKSLNDQRRKQFHSKG